MPRDFIAEMQNGSDKKAQKVDYISRMQSSVVESPDRSVQIDNTPKAQKLQELRNAPEFNILPSMLSTSNDEILDSIENTGKLPDFKKKDSYRLPLLSAVKQRLANAFISEDMEIGRSVQKNVPGAVARIDEQGRNVVDLPSGTYEINKSGFSKQDADQLAAQGMMALLPMGAVAKTAPLAAKIGAGAAASAADALIGQGVEKGLGGEFDPSSIGLSATIGGAIPAVGAGASKLFEGAQKPIRSFTDKASEFLQNIVNQKPQDQELVDSLLDTFDFNKKNIDTFLRLVDSGTLNKQSSNLEVLSNNPTLKALVSSGYSTTPAGKLAGENLKKDSEKSYSDFFNKLGFKSEDAEFNDFLYQGMKDRFARRKSQADDIRGKVNKMAEELGVKSNAKNYREAFKNLTSGSVSEKGVKLEETNDFLDQLKKAQGLNLLKDDDSVSYKYISDAMSKLNNELFDAKSKLTLNEKNIARELKTALEKDMDEALAQPFSGKFDPIMNSKRTGDLYKLKKQGDALYRANYEQVDDLKNIFQGLKDAGKGQLVFSNNETFKRASLKTVNQMLQGNFENFKLIEKHFPKDDVRQMLLGGLIAKAANPNSGAFQDFQMGKLYGIDKRMNNHAQKFAETAKQYFGAENYQTLRDMMTLSSAVSATATPPTGATAWMQELANVGIEKTGPQMWVERIVDYGKMLFQGKVGRTPDFSVAEEKTSAAMIRTMEIVSDPQFRAGIIDAYINKSKGITSKTVIKSKRLDDYIEGMKKTLSDRDLDAISNVGFFTWLVSDIQGGD